MGTTAEKLNAVLQTKNELKTLLKNISSVDDSTPFKEYPTVIKKLMSNNLNISIPFTSSTLSYDSLNPTPSNFSVTYNTGFTQTNLLGVQNVETTIVKEAKYSHFSIIPSITNGFNQHMWEGEHKYFKVVKGHYYGFAFEAEFDFNLSSLNNIAVYKKGSEAGTNIFVNTTLFSYKNMFYQVWLFDEEDQEITIEWKIRPSDDIKGEYLELVAKNMHIVDLGTEEITAEKFSKQYPTYFENTAHSKFNVYHYYPKEIVYEKNNATAIAYFPIKPLEVGKSISCQIKIKFVSTASEDPSSAKMGFLLVARYSDNSYKSYYCSELVNIGEEKILKNENFVITDDLVELTARTHLVGTSNVYNYSDFQVDYSDKCEDYTPYSYEYVGTYELNGEEEEKALERYYWFKPIVGGGIEYEAIDNSLLPKLNETTLNYFAELTNDEIAETISALNTKEVY